MKYVQPGSGRVRKGSDGRWGASFTIGYDGAGRQVRRRVTASTEGEAIRKRNALLKELLAGNRATGQETVQTWAERWLTEIAFYRLHPNVLADHRSKIRLYIVPTLGRYRLRDVGAEEVRELHAAARAAGLAERTVQIVHTVLSTCLRDAVREGLLDMNPCDRVARPQANQRVRPALTVEQAKRMLIVSAEADDELTSLWASALMLGSRKGELIGLERERLDVPRGEVDMSWQIQTIPWAHGRGCSCGEAAPAAKCPSRSLAAPPGFEMRPCVGARVWTRPKTSASVRLTPLPEPLRLTLGKHCEETTAGPLGLVWETADGLPLGARTVTSRWQDALARAEVPAVDFHSARHTTASLLLEVGVSPEVIAQIMGHSSIAATRGYLHVGHRQARDAMQALGELFA